MGFNLWKYRGVRGGFCYIVAGKWHNMYSSLLRAPNLSASNMSWPKTLDTDTTALYAPSVAQIGLSAASMPPNCWGIDRT